MRTGDNYYSIVNDRDFTVFRKVTVPQTVAPKQYIEVDRNAQVGERIRIVNVACGESRYGNGAEGIVTDTSGQSVVRAEINGMSCRVLRKEYVVLEPVKEQPYDIVEVDGVKYRKIDRDSKVGDFVYMLQDETGLTQGKLYEITRTDEYGGVFEDDDEDTRSFGGNSRHRQLVERIATSEDLEREVSEMKTKLAEVEAQLATKKAEEEKARDPRNVFAAGDKVRLISGGNDHPLNGYKNGEVYTVRDPLYVYSKKIEITGGEIRTGYALPEQLVKLTEKEIAEMNRLKIGEYARVVSDKNRDGSQRTDVLVGDIAEIIEDDGSMTPFRAKLIRDGSTTWFREEALVCATDGEVAEGKAKAYKASFKVGEYARVVKDNYEHRVGHVMKISGLEDEDSPFDFKVDRLTIGGYGYIKAENIEKINAEEAGEAKRKLEQSKFAEGDYVKVIVDTEDLDEGSIGKITEVDTGDTWPLRVELLDGSDDYWYKPNQLEKVTEEVAKWAAIGRKVGEFKEGDIARVTPSGRGDKGHPVGTIGVIEYCPTWSKLRLRAGGNLYSHTGNMELVAPVESVVNLTASN
ncbi:hypothetical protein [Paenibacillus apiarius]|uniref:hypothetical protein n=1 Tax=Paenibacillus apiarius TaxID=46240 RepID=UPI003B3BE450